MIPRLDAPYKLVPDAIKAMTALEAAIKNSGLEYNLIELVKLRASQVNGCAFCINMHTTDLRAHGETEMRIYMLTAWRESPLYSDRERAALAWTEALTLLAATGAPNLDYELLNGEFTENEQVNLTMLIGSINVWNRLQVGFRVLHPVDEAKDRAHAAA